MKKITSILVAMSMTFSALMPFAHAATDEDFLVCEAFDNYKTNSVPDVGNHVLTDSSRVMEDGDSNKVFNLNGAMDNTVNYTFDSASTETVVDFELEFKTNNVGADVCVVTQSGSVLKLLSFDIGGSAKTWDGYDTKISAVGKKVHITMLLNSKTHAYTVNQNGKCILDNWICTSLSQGIEGFEIIFGGDGEKYEAILDNVRIYKGTKLMPDRDIPYVKYESESIEYKEIDTTEEAVGEEVFLNEDFENAQQNGQVNLSGIGANNKGNPMSIEYDRARKSSYLLFQGFSGDPHIDVSITDAKKRMVVELDVRSDNFTGSGPFLLIRNQAGAGFNSFSMSGGNIKYPDGTSLVTLEKGVWHHIAVAYNFTLKTYNVYLDKELVRENIVFGNKEVDSVSLIRMHISSCGNGGSEYSVDNYKVYEGKEPKTEGLSDIAEKDTSVFESDKDISDSLQNAVAMVNGRKIMWAGDKKCFLDTAPELIGDVTYIPVRAVSEAFGCEVNWNAEKRQVTLAESVVTVDDKKAIIGGSETELSDAPVIKNDRCLMPLRAICENILNKNVYWNDGLIVIGDGEYTHGEDDKFINRTKEFIKFYRPDAETIKADFEANGKGVHPRIMISQSNIDNVKKYLKEGNPKVKEYYDTIIAKADEYMTADVAQFVLPDGYRLLATSQDVLFKMRTLGLAWQLTGDSKYPERAWLELKSAGNFNSWNYRHHLDVGEMTTAFAVGYDWMYDYWTKAQRKFIADAIYEKSVSTYYAKFMQQSSPVTFQSWTNGTNWNTVCNGGTIIGALVAAEYYPEVCYDTISKCIRSTETFWNEFGPEGSWPEGPGYLTYALEYIDFMISSMNASLNTSYGLLDMGEIGGIGDFYAQTDGYIGANNYQDMAPGHQYIQYLYWLANARGQKALGNIQTKLTANLSRTLTANESICCMLWYDPDYEDISTISFPLDYKFSQAELFASRTSWSGNDGIYISAHAGDNSHNHWHVDGGTFVLDAMGERWAMDHGPDDYNAKEGYFSKNRYKFYRVRAEGHNCVVINPDSGLGQEWECFCPITRFENNARSCIAVMDLQDAYRTQVDSYQRGFKFEDDRRTVTMRDEIKLKESSELYWFMQTSADVTINDDKKGAVLTIGFKKMYMEIASDAPYEFYVTETVPLETSPNAEGQTLPGKKRVTLKYTGVSNVNLSVKFTPQDSHGITPGLNDIPIDSWTLEEGEYKEMPRLSMLYADGVPINNFNSKDTNYKLSSPKSRNDVPIITADAPDGIGYEIEQSTDIATPSRVKVYYINSPQDAQYYSVGYVLLPDLPDLNGKKRYQALSLTVSSEPQPDNGKENALNGIIGDRWAAPGNNEWMLIDLGEEKSIGQIGTAFIQGDARVASYAYKISNDGENFETVFDGKSSGKTTDYEFIDVNKKARYVKFEGYGNTVNSWNSISEIAILSN